MQKIAEIALGNISTDRKEHSLKYSERLSSLVGHVDSSVILSSLIGTLAISGYRSLRYLVLPLDCLNLVTGANGSGKSSLYRALRLLGDASLNSVVSSLAREGGLAPPCGPVRRLSVVPFVKATIQSNQQLRLNRSA